MGNSARHLRSDLRVRRGGRREAWLRLFSHSLSRWRVPLLPPLLVQSLQSMSVRSGLGYTTYSKVPYFTSFPRKVFIRDELTLWRGSLYFSSAQKGMCKESGRMGHLVIGSGSRSSRGEEPSRTPSPGRRAGCVQARSEEPNADPSPRSDVPAISPNLTEHITRFGDSPSDLAESRPSETTATLSGGGTVAARDQIAKFVTESLTTCPYTSASSRGVGTP